MSDIDLNGLAAVIAALGVIGFGLLNRRDARANKAAVADVKTVVAEVKTVAETQDGKLDVIHDLANSKLDKTLARIDALEAELREKNADALRDAQERGAADKLSAAEAASAAIAAAVTAAAGTPQKEVS